MKLSRRLSAVLALSLLVTSTTTAMPYTKGTDVSGHWAEGIFNDWIGRGDLAGDGQGHYNPGAQISKAEFAAMLTNIVNASEVESDLEIKDVNKDDWHYNAISKAVAMGAMELDESGKFNPSELMQRDDVAKAIDAVMNYENAGNENELDEFSDINEVDGEYIEPLQNVVDKGLFVGFKGQLTPNKPITRAEVISVLSRLTGTIIGDNNTYEQDINGNVTVVKAGCAFKNMIINGDLYLAEGITEGDIILDGVTVTGDIYVNMDKSSKLVIKDTDIRGDMSVSSISGDSVIEVSGSTGINNVYINSGCTLTSSGELTGNAFENIAINNVPDEQKVTVDTTVGKLDASKVDVETKVFVTGNADINSSDLGENTEIVKEDNKPSGGSGSSSGGSSSGGSGSEGGSGSGDSKPDINEGSEMITSFEDGIPSFVTSGNAAIEVVTDGATEGSNALRVKYEEADFPSLVFTPEEGTTWDFGEDKALAFDVYNPTDTVVMLHTKMSAINPTTGGRDETINRITIQPRSHASLFAGYSENSLDLGMRGLPPHPAGQNLEYGWGPKSLDLSKVLELQFWLMYPSQEHELIFDNIRIINDPNVDLSYIKDTVDEYGQYTGKDWDGKVKSDSDLIAHKEAEENEYASGRPEYMSRYGGWKEGPQLEATGKFRTVKYGDKWTMVDPDGYLFFATGVDCVRFSDAFTWIDGRREMFKNLPSDEGELAEHFGHTANVARPPLGLEEGQIFNFYTANLERKYGDNYEQAWKDMTIARFKSWGFSTIGNWSEPALFFGKGEEMQTTYAANAWINGNHAMLSSGNEFAPNIADPFDPEFRNSANKCLSDVANYGVDDDEWCMGIYVDNEIAWGNPNTDAEHYASITNTFKDDVTDEDSYAKRAFIDVLKAKYDNDISELNTSWGESIDSWGTLEASYTLPTLKGGVLEDVSDMLYILANQYYKVVDEELEQVLPNTLNLGSRFAEWGTSIEVQKAAANYVDIVSFNVYKDDINQSWIYAEDLDMPCIVGEFQFGSKDRGMFSDGMISAIDQEDRGVRYDNYITEAANNDYFIGAHWFQYMDQPLTGRAWDGENYNSGFVDSTDTPYKELVDAARNVHGKIYDIRFNKVEVEGISLDQTSLELSKDASTAKLTASISPSNATFKEVNWSTSDERIVTVDGEGNLVGIANGTATITATAKDNDSVKATCEVTVTGYADIICTFDDIIFKDFTSNEDIAGWVNPQAGAKADIESGKGLVVTTVYDTNWGGADAFSKAIEISPKSGEWSFGANPTLKVKITNPYDEVLKMGMNINDKVGGQKQHYFDLPAGETTEITYDNWKGSFLVDKVGMVMFYIIEPGTDTITNNSFTIESIIVEDNSNGEATNPEEPQEAVLTDFNKIEFGTDQVGEGIGIWAQENATYEIVTQTTTPGGLYIKSDIGEGQYYPQTFYQKDSKWIFGTEPTFKLNVYNPGSEDLDLNVKVGSDWSVVDEVKFTVPAGTTKELIIDEWINIDLDGVMFISVRPSDEQTGAKEFTIVSMEVTNNIPEPSKSNFENIDFTTATDEISYVTPNGGGTTLNLDLGLEVINTAHWTGVKINEGGFWDFGTNPIIKVEIYNPESENVGMGMNIGSDDTDPTGTFMDQTWFSIPAGETKVIEFKDWSKAKLNTIDFVSIFTAEYGDKEEPNGRKFIVKNIEVINDID